MENCGRFVKWSRNPEFSGFGCGDLLSEFSTLFTDMRGYKYIFNGSRGSSYFLLLPTYDIFFNIFHLLVKSLLPVIHSLWPTVLLLSEQKRNCHD